MPRGIILWEDSREAASHKMLKAGRSTEVSRKDSIYN